MIRRAASLITLAAVLAGCAAEQATIQAGAPAAQETRPTAWPTENRVIPDSSVSTGSGSVTTAAPSAAPAVRRTTAPPAGRSRKDWAPLTVALSETCVQHGDELIVTATSDPKAGIGFAAGYSKPPQGAEKIIPDYAYFDHEANPTGTISWSFTIRPTIPYGPGVVKVVVNGADGRGAFASLDIEVARTCP